MLSSDSQQGIYAPLSQVMSDSDSEEEIHNSSRHTRRQQQNQSQNQQQQQQYHHQSHNSFQSQQQQQRQSRQRSSQRHQQGFHTRSNLQYHQKYPNGHQMHHSSSMSLQNSFRSVMDGGSNFTSFNSDGEERHQTDADNVAILGPPETKDEPMTTTRKCCFIGSILLCVLTVVIFLWVIPCSEEGTCPAPPDRIKTHNWLNNYTKIELKGVINVVDGLRNWEKNLIFLYRGDAFFPEFEPSNTKRNGIISLIGSSGAIAWFDEMVDEPITIDCTLIDIDKNGKPDCLVIDQFGELGVINPISGQWHWKFRVRSKTKVDALDFPVILPDLDGDGVYEILLATTSPILHYDSKPKNFITPHENFHGDAPSGARNLLRILSGRIGKPIGDGYKVHDCDILRKFQLEKKHIITFNCVRNSTEVQRSKSLTELFSLVTNRSIKSEKLTPALKISQHRHYGQRKETEAQRNIYSLSGRELIVENRGKCPDDCNVSFILSEERNGRVNVVRNFTNPGMYGMVPAQWHFKNSKSKMSGFVMKFWKWKNDSASLGRRKKREQSKKEEEADFPTSEFNIFDHLVQKRNTYTIPEKIARVERSTANITSSTLLLNNYKRQLITETVVLVIFIGSDTRIENTSQSDIIQFCSTELDEVVCQPDLNNQENSLLIADLDQDGSQELVSYYSTFKKEDQSKDWKLVTYVQLLRLESELPGFYVEGKRY